jgi:rod shape determining protein RodA
MDVPLRPPLALDRAPNTRADVFLILPVVALSALGAIMIFSASAPRLESLGETPSSILVRQLLFIAAGFVVFAAASVANERSIRAAAPYMYFAAVLLLVAVLTPIGDIRAGAQRWIALGSIQIQPSEFAKPAIIVALAALLAPVQDQQLTWSRILRALALVSVPAILIVRQPDLGTMLVFGFVAMVMLFVAGASMRQLGALFVGGLVALFVAVRLGFFEFQQYQLDRLTAFLDQTSDIDSVNYNLFQSRVTIGSGGLFGKGLFEGTQTNLSFVPSQTTDFIFTAVGEQLGFIGGALVIFLYAVIVWRLLLIAANANDRFGRIMVSGVAALIGVHAVVNVGMTIGIMPVTGLPLPFMSQGGSAYVAMALALGLAHAIWLSRSPVPGERRLL